MFSEHFKRKVKRLSRTNEVKHPNFIIRRDANKEEEEKGSRS